MHCNLNFNRHTIAALHERPTTLLGEITQAKRRCVHHTQNGLPVFNERDIDRELAISIYEFFGAIQRVN